MFTAASWDGDDSSLKHFSCVFPMGALPVGGLF
jgi:hypothetical protein